MIDYRKLYSKYDKEDLINTCINLKEYKEKLRKEVNKSYMICNEKDKEIERLNKALLNIKEQLKYKTNDSAINMLSILEIIEDIVNKAIGSDKE